MLNRVIKIVSYVLLQVTLLITPTSIFAEVEAHETTTPEPVQVEITSDYALPHSASRSMSIEGASEDSDIASCMSLALDVLDALPEEHREALEELTLMFDSDAKRGQAGGNIMRLRCVDVSDEEFAAVLIHEMGHVVDTGLIQGSYGDENEFKDGKKPVLSDDMSARFYEISWISNYAFSEGTDGYSFISRYAKTDPFEDFAESYLTYILHGETFRTYASSNDDLSEKYEFLKKYVFDGVEYEGISLAEVNDERVYDVTKLPFDLDLFLNSW